MRCLCNEMLDSSYDGKIAKAKLEELKLYWTWPHGYGIKVCIQILFPPSPILAVFVFFVFASKARSSRWSFLLSLGNKSIYLCDSRWWFPKCHSSTLSGPSRLLVWLDKRIIGVYQRRLSQYGPKKSWNKARPTLDQAQHDTVNWGARAPTMLCPPDHFQDRYGSLIGYTQALFAVAPNICIETIPTVARWWPQNAI